MTNKTTDTAITALIVRQMLHSLNEASRKMQAAIERLPELSALAAGLEQAGIQYGLGGNQCFDVVLAARAAQTNELAAVYRVVDDFCSREGWQQRWNRVDAAKGRYHETIALEKTDAGTRLYIYVEIKNGEHHDFA